MIGRRLLVMDGELGTATTPSPHLTKTLDPTYGGVAGVTELDARVSLEHLADPPSQVDQPSQWYQA